MNKTLNLELHPSNETPKNSAEQYPQYIIISKSQFYYVALGIFKSDGNFDHFKAWKRGQLVEIKPNQYQYWGELPTQLS